MKILKPGGDTGQCPVSHAKNNPLAMFLAFFKSCLIFLLFAKCFVTDCSFCRSKKISSSVGNVYLLECPLIETSTVFAKQIDEVARWENWLPLTVVDLSKPYVFPYVFPSTT